MEYAIILYYVTDSQGRSLTHKLYLAPFMDMYNGEIISYGISKTPSVENIMKALANAIKHTASCQYRKMFHSDQGRAYQMKSYTNKLKGEGIFQSMSRKGNFHDNSVMENFFGLLKQEIYYGKTYYSYGELKQAIEDYIKYYHEKRIKERLGWLRPKQYRLRHSIA